MDGIPPSQELEAVPAPRVELAPNREDDELWLRMEEDNEDAWDIEQRPPIRSLYPSHGNGAVHAIDLASSTGRSVKLPKTRTGC